MAELSTSLVRGRGLAQRAEQLCQGLNQCCLGDLWCHGHEAGQTCNRVLRHRSPVRENKHDQHSILSQEVGIKNKTKGQAGLINTYPGLLLLVNNPGFVSFVVSFVVSV